MSNPWVIASPKQAPLLDAACLIAAAEARFGPRATVNVRPEGPTDVELGVALPGDPPYSITRSRDGSSISVDGTPAQNADVAAWLRSLLTPGFPRLIAFDMGWSGHAELPAGVTAEEIANRWIDHRLAGWNAGDPDLS